MTETSLIDTKKVTAVDVYEKDGGVDAVLEMVSKAVAEFEPDTSTRQSRAEIASVAARVASSKTFLDGQGKAMVDEMKAVTGAIDAKRKTIRDTLDALKKDVRKPLTEWEEAEADRVAVHEGNIKEIVEAGRRSLLDWDTLPLIAMRERLAEIQAEESGEEHWEEFVDMAEEATLRSIGEIRSAIEKREKADTEKAEVQQLREEAEERGRADREAEAQKRRDEREARIKEEAEADADRKVQEAEDRAANAEKEAKAKAEAEQKARDQAERERAADEKHRDRIEGDAVEAFIIAGLGEETSATIVAHIARGDIPNVKITY